MNVTSKSALNIGRSFARKKLKQKFDVKNFDLFVGIDWSGSKALNTKSIAVAETEQGKNAPKLLPDLRSRTAVAQYIVNLTKYNKRVLIGIDANFGYCRSIGQKHFGNDYTAQDQWRIVDEFSKNDSNFYAQGFWQSPQFVNDFWLAGKTPDWFNPETLRRQTEIQCIKDGYGHPESPFKMCYTKQVGKGGLAAQRMAHYLQSGLGPKIAIWPFEANDDAQIVMTEIYPRQFLMRSGHGTTKVRNLTDLNNVLPFFNSEKMQSTSQITDHDTDALVSAAGLRYLCRPDAVIPKAISNPKTMNETATRCEGWIFGVGDQG